MCYGNIEPETCVSLIDRARHDDPDAWRQFFEIYAPVVYSRCRRFGLSEEDSADLTQETMCNIFRSRQHLPVPPRRSGEHETAIDDDADDGKHACQMPATFRPWIRKVTANAVKDYFRKQRIRYANWNPEQFEALADSFLDQDSESDQRVPEDTISLHFPRSRTDEDQLLAAAMRARRKKVLEKNWQAFWRTVIDELPDDMVAIALGMTPKAVRQARYETLRDLRARTNGLIGRSEEQKVS